MSTWTSEPSQHSFMVTHTKDRHSSFLVLNIPHEGGYRLSRYGDADTLKPVQVLI